MGYKNSVLYYAGIGSRHSPKNMLPIMINLGMVMDLEGYTLRSGGAKGERSADIAFASGTLRREIFRPIDATPESIKVAMSLHPAPHNCNDYTKKLHGRNVQIMLGRHLDEYVKFMVCWTSNEERGGTSMGIRIAKKFGIDYFNLANGSDYSRITKFLKDRSYKFWSHV
jgi:hypothetical protein